MAEEVNNIIKCSSEKECSSINEFDFRNSIDKQKENPGNEFYLDFLSLL